MDREILFWSTVSGLVLGLLVGAALVGVAVLVSGIAPSASARVSSVLLAPALVLVLCLVVLPAAGAVLGYLEGRLKLG